MALLGDLLIRAGIDTSSLSKGLGAAQGYLAKFGKNVLSTKNLVIGFGAALGAGLVINGLKDITLAQFDAIDAASDMASQIGTTIGALQGMQYAVSLTGSDAETLNSALAKMTLGLGKVGDDSDKCGAALVKLGLNQDALAASDPVEAFQEIAGAIAGYGTAADQAAIAADIFGNANVGLLNSINAGPEQLAALRQEAEALGLSVSAVDANKIGEAKDAMDKVSYALQGVGNTLIVELAPYITAASTYMMDFAKSGMISAKTVSQGFNMILEGIKFVVDAVHFLSYGWNAFSGIVQGIASGVIGGLSLIAKAVDYVFDAVGIGATGAGQYLEELSESYADAATDNFKKVGNILEDPLPSAEITKFQNSITQAAADAEKEMNNLGRTNDKVARGVLNLLDDVNKLNEELGARVANFGKSSEEAKINSLQEKLNKEREALQQQIDNAEEFKAKGHTKAYDEMQGDISAKQKAIDETQAQLDVASAYREQLEALEEKKKLEEEIAGIQQKAADEMKSEAEKLIESMKSPLEKYEDEIAKIQKLQDAGLIDSTVAEKAKAKVQEKYNNEEMNGDSKPEFQLTGLAEFGSSEARKTILANRFGNNNDVGKQHLEVGKQQLQGINRLNRNISNLGIQGKKLSP